MSKELSARIDAMLNQVFICANDQQQKTFNRMIVLLADCKAALPQVPDGKVLVPVEPTDAMVDALFPGTGTHTCRELYKAMLAASQENE
jgi:hypothetical protein